MSARYQAPVSDPDVMAEWVQRIMVADAQITESKLRVLIRPKPRLLPERIWRRLLARMLYLEVWPSARPGKTE